MSKLSSRHDHVAITLSDKLAALLKKKHRMATEFIDSTPLVKFARTSSNYKAELNMNLRLNIFCGQLMCLVAVLNGKSLQSVPGYGRNLIIKTLPAVEGYQSNVYEVYMEPYLYVSNLFSFYWVWCKK